MEKSPPYFATIIGAGPAGIALACKLSEAGVENFVLFDRNAGPGGTWYANSYPGVNWTHRLAFRDELLSYYDEVMKTYGVDAKAHYQTECTKAIWQRHTSSWSVSLRNIIQKTEIFVETRLLFFATGLFDQPKYPNIHGIETFKGEIWHSARWNHRVDLSGKRVAVIGSGPSAMQLIPAIATQTLNLIHFPGGPRWIDPEENEAYSASRRWLHRNLPTLTRIRRIITFWSYEMDYFEKLHNSFALLRRSWKQRKSHKYMQEKIPKQYFESMVPDYPFGCKRHVTDSGYLNCLKHSTVKIETSNIANIDEIGIRTTDGRHQKVDCIVLATGFSVGEFLAHINIIGERENDMTLNDYWSSMGGPQALNSVSVAGYPNMAMLFGPNGVPAHNSAIFNIEVQADYILRIYVKTLLLNRAKRIDVKESVQVAQAEELQQRSAKRFFVAHCAVIFDDTSQRDRITFLGFSTQFWDSLRKTTLADHNLD